MLKRPQGWRRMKKGDFLLEQSKDGTTQDLHTWGFNFAFLPCLHSTVLLGFPWTRLLAHLMFPLLSHCHWNTKSLTKSSMSCTRLADLHALEIFTVLQCLLIEYPLTVPAKQEPLFWTTTDCFERPGIPGQNVIHAWSSKVEVSFVFCFYCRFYFILYVLLNFSCSIKVILQVTSFYLLVICPLKMCVLHLLTWKKMWRKEEKISGVRKGMGGVKGRREI